MLVSHFRDEEYLLPFWIRHHLKFFDRAVLIDYHSRDNSRRIAHELAPNWTVLSSVNHSFESTSVDEEVSELERAISGWKICLNTTEFLVGNLEKEVSEAQAGTLGIRLLGRTLVDKCPSEELEHASDLVTQKPWGLDITQYEFLRLAGRLHEINPELVLALDPIRRGRLLHRSADAGYHAGRHTWDLEDVVDSTNLEVWWCGLSPWTERGIHRKDQMAKAVPLSDLARGRGGSHLLPMAELTRARRILSEYAKTQSDSLWEVRSKLEALSHLKSEGRLSPTLNRVAAPGIRGIVIARGVIIALRNSALFRALFYRWNNRRRKAS